MKLNTETIEIIPSKSEITQIFLSPPRYLKNVRTLTDQLIFDYSSRTENLNCLPRSS